MLVENRIKQKIEEKFSPIFLQIENESHRHSSGRGAESHFKVTLVSHSFENLRLVARHQLVYQLLHEELATVIHALALHLYTENEWKNCGETIPESTNCLGSGK